MIDINICKASIAAKENFVYLIWKAERLKIKEKSFLFLIQSLELFLSIN